MITREQVNAALRQASEENSLPEYYRDLVLPLLWMPRDRWPTCCGSNCEPCSVALVRVADKTLALLGVDAPIPE
jgi:hypothetical protein